MKHDKFDLFQLDTTNGERFPFYPRPGGYTRSESDKMIAQYRKAGCNLTKRRHNFNIKETAC